MEDADWDNLPDDDDFETPAPRLSATEEVMWVHLDVRARELALEKAVELHTKMSAIVQPDGSRVEPNVLFTAQAFYDFLTGESDGPADSTEQPQ